jgi:hypothetical protein
MAWANWERHWIYNDFGAISFLRSARAGIADAGDIEMELGPAARRLPDGRHL